MRSEAANLSARLDNIRGLWIPREILFRRDMSFVEKGLLAEIDSLTRGPYGCIAGNTYFEAFFQLSVRQIKRYIARLVEFGWVEDELLGRTRRRLRVTARLKEMRDTSDAPEGQERPLSEGQKRPPISTKKIKKEKLICTQGGVADPSNGPRQRSVVEIATIPAELKSLDHWVLWRWEKRDGKWVKPPYQTDGSLAKTNDPATWVSFQTAVAAFETGHFDGVGFVLTADDPYTMADLDHCFDTGGSVSAWVAEIVDHLHSYTEITPSGHGLRVIVRARLPIGRHKRGVEGGGDVELYDRLRYMTMTGNCLAGTPATIEERQSEMAEVHGRLFGSTPQGVRAGTDRGRTLSALTNNELLAKARTAKNGNKFCALFDGGDISSYPSASEADLALCGMLSFWTGGDAERIDMLFRRSALFRPGKWDVEHFAGGTTYGNATVAKAVAGTREFHRPTQEIAQQRMENDIHSRELLDERPGPEKRAEFAGLLRDVIKKLERKNSKDG